MKRLAALVATMALLTASLSAPARADLEDEEFFEETIQFSNIGSPAIERYSDSYSGPEKPGTIVVDTARKRLYHILSGGKMMVYGVGVGREGFQWSGRSFVSRKAEWPSWTPPPEMHKRRPGLPKFMPGGPGNPMGARALYIGSTLYRIHGTNNSSTIGRALSSGCIRLKNADVIHLYNRVEVGARVVVY